jgi:hypothetical protein
LRFTFLSATITAAIADCRSSSPNYFSHRTSATGTTRTTSAAGTTTPSAEAQVGLLGQRRRSK